MSNTQKDEPTGARARTTRLTDPRALRAYAHPTRMRLVGLLRTEGPFTATRAADLIGESVASCSYHLRMLAKYGLVEVAPGGQGREKPWRATARFTQWPNYSEDPAVAEASRALETAVAERYFELMTRAIEERHDLPREWQEAEHIGDQVLYLTAEELADLAEKLDGLLRPYEDRQGDPAARPQGVRLVQIIRAAFPLPQRLAGNEETSTPPDSAGGPR
ncbi:helix-turn-helix domain-containing protein [Streptomyces sp. PSAA01]|uniref:winged helix-turn-helix domain-containing protein n=1 Tax=Streptomyces sp. PSAA01 TaxID=2912762 RepID=UPI001F3AA559|nr:helix-turn-helix domain-containing protein [Streptomyces sp. PSAA01]MCG0283933.1 helix-turn-helix domain-containing protein [Streptomyces sp. PSAA01]